MFLMGNSEWLYNMVDDDMLLDKSQVYFEWVERVIIYTLLEGASGLR